MNTNHLKKFAQEARRKLLELVGSKLEYVLNTDSAELREKASQIKKLQEEINATNKEQVIEKVAYTWFNRLMALRFMDANDYQPTGINVVTPKAGYTLPELLDEAKQGNVPDELPINQQHVYDVLDGRIPSSNPQNEAYKELLIGACNHLNKVFPFLFEKLSDYTELLLPDDLISEFSIVQDIRDGMTIEDCQEVEIIGWIYQFYISEKKDEVFASKSKVKKEDIPAATQLFTPRWIVEYMVQNTVGKLWLQNKPNSKLREHMPYFIESPSVNSDDYLKINSVEEITLLDQACGSGHILVYGFELLSKIYEEEGYNPSEIPQLIIEKNLFGFEIDERASQLAGMALMMKARNYQRRVFRKELKPNILCYQDLKLTTDEIREAFRGIGTDLSDELLHDLKNIQQATNFGSLIIPHTPLSEIELVEETIKEKYKTTSDVFLKSYLEQIKSSLSTLQKLATKYHCVVDNPPYMGSRKMDNNLKAWLRGNYPMAYQDLFSCFIIRAKEQLVLDGLGSFITLQGWMFVSSFEDFRYWLLENYSFNSLVQVGGNSFPSLNSQVARAVTFSVVNSQNNSKLTKSFDLDSVDNSHGVDKKRLFEDYISSNKFVERNFGEFRDINRFTFLHSISKNLLEAFKDSSAFENYAKPKQGLATGSNDRFVRFWHEINIDTSYWSGLSQNIKWHPYNKGGDFRKWYGNNDNVVNWEDNGHEIKNFFGSNGKLRSRPQNESYYFKEGVTYSLIGNSEFCARYYPEGYLFDVGGSGFFPLKDNLHFLLGLVNSKVGSLILSKLNPTVNFQVGDIGNIPVKVDEDLKKKVTEIVQENIRISKSEWQGFEENSEFHKSELIHHGNSLDIEDSIEMVLFSRIKKFAKLYSNEIELNNLFAELYKLDIKKINTKNVKVSCFGISRLDSEPLLEEYEQVWKKDIIFDFLNYFVGISFGRYSLDKEGLILANQGETLEDNLKKVEKSEAEVSFLPDDDNIIPILDDEWFEDDIVGRFYEFLKVTFGEANFEKNLAFIEDCIGKDIRKFFVKDFYKDHIKRYKKKPIYWMFSSPKGSFNVLIYMHRYTPDTLNQILNDYLKEYRGKLNTHLEHLDHIIETGSSSEQTKASKEKDKLRLVLLELQEYERDVLYPLATERIAIDLDDGVLVNYNRFGSAIKLVPGLNDNKAKEKVTKFDWIDTSKIR